jgi:hypothetical protein
MMERSVFLRTLLHSIRGGSCVRYVRKGLLIRETRRNCPVDRYSNPINNLYTENDIPILSYVATSHVIICLAAPAF